MSFADDLAAFFAKTRYKTQAAFVNTVSAVEQSVKFGSPLTGAPGQPVQTGNLRDSWMPRFLSPTEALVSTNVEYAPIIEYNVRGATLRSKVGGFHSVALTVAGFEKLVEAEVRKVNP